MRKRALRSELKCPGTEGQWRYQASGPGLSGLRAPAVSGDGTTDMNRYARAKLMDVCGFHTFLTKDPPFTYASLEPFFKKYIFYQTSYIY